MKRWLRDISGAVLASLLTIALNGIAYADELMAQFVTVPAEVAASVFHPAADAQPSAAVSVSDLLASAAESVGATAQERADVAASNVPPDEAPSAEIQASAGDEVSTAVVNSAANAPAVDESASEAPSASVAVNICGTS